MPADGSRLAGVGCAAVALVTLGACGAPSVNLLGPSRYDPSPAPSVSLAPFPTVGGTCPGVSGPTAAVALVRRAKAQVLVSAHITQQPGPAADFSRTVSVDRASIVAGDSSHGPVRRVQETAANDGENDLPPGSYLLLLSPTSTRSTYSLADVSDSFELTGGQAYERCESALAPTPVLATSGVTDRVALTRLLTGALSR